MSAPPPRSSVRPRRSHRGEGRASACPASCNRPEVENRIVSRLAKRVSHLYCTERVDVQVARSLAEERCLQEAVLAVDELLLLEEIKDLADFSVDGVDVPRERKEGSIEEGEKILLGSDVPRSDTREDVHPERGLGPQLRLNRFRVAEEIFLNQFVYFVDVLGEQDRFSVLVVFRPTRPTAHLLDFEDRDRGEAEIDIEPIQVANDYSAGWEVQTARKCRCGDDTDEPSFPKFLFHDRPLRVRQSRVMKRDSVFDASRQPGAH